MKYCLIFLSAAILGTLAARLPKNDQNGSKSGHDKGAFPCLFFAYSPRLLIGLGPLTGKFGSRNCESGNWVAQ